MLNEVCQKKKTMTKSKKTSENDQESEHFALLLAINTSIGQQTFHKVAQTIFAFRGKSHKDSITFFIFLNLALFL